MKTAITGGIAEGKSTVLAILAEMDFETLSLDEVARSMFVEPDINGLIAHVAGFRDHIEASQLRTAIMADGSVRRAVNRILHPRIAAELRRSSADFIEVPLLIEVCMQGHFDRVWVVTSGAEVQLERLKARYGPDWNPALTLASQLPTGVKIAFADEVIRTNEPLETVRRNISLAVTRRFD